MKQFLAIFLFIVSLSVAAQTGGVTTGYVQASVLDQKDNEPVSYALVSLLQPADSVYVRGVTTDSIGQFQISATAGKYILSVTFMGYERYLKNIEITTDAPNLSLGKIYLKDKAIMLGEAVVVGEVPAIQVKGDTIEYNSDSFKPEENSMLRDLINNIPGLEADENGNITANGKPISKILVDGKEFFGNDIPLALANLPANMIKKLQLFKEESEQAKITGFKDKEPEQVLNLVVKDELKQSVFGNAIAGYGSDDRYTTKMNVNYMRGETQATLIGNINNISDGPMTMSSGEDKEQNVGGNVYISPIEKMKLGVYANYTNSENVTKIKTNTQTYLENGDRLSKQEMRTENSNKSFNTGFNLNWDIDSLTTIYARSNIRIDETDNRNRTNGISYVEAALDTTTTMYDTRSRGDGYSVNSSLTAGRKLNDKGRALSLSLNHSTRRNDEKGTNNSTTDYTDATPSILLDQQSKTKLNNDSYGFSTSYVEPVGENKLIQLSYSYNQSNSNRTKNTWKKDAAGEYTLLDSTYTRETESKNTSQNIAIEFQSTKEKYSYNIGFSIDPSSSESNVWLLDSIIDNVKQNVVNYSPSFRFSYTPTSSSSLDFNYYGNTGQASTSQLSKDTTIVNASNRYYGNPNLKASYSNYVNVNYQKSDYEVGRFLYLSGGFNYIFNNIVSYSIIDKLGNTENTYRNVDGNMGANLSFIFNTPLKNKKFTVNSSTHTNYNRNVAFTNEKKAVTNNVVIGENVSVKFKVKKFETNLRVGASFNIAKNNLSGVDNRNTATYSLRNQTTVKLPFDFSVQSDIKYSRYSGYGEDFDKGEILWNASVNKLFLKNKKGSLRLQFFDILNDRNNLSRTITSSYSSDRRVNSINRYFMCSFVYQFNLFTGNKGGVDSMDDANI